MTTYFKYWDEFHHVVSKNAKSVYIAMFDEIDEGTAMFKLAENKSMQPREGLWVPLDMDGYTLPSDWYLRTASLATQVVKGYEDNKAEFSDLGNTPEGIMAIRLKNEEHSDKKGEMEFVFGFLS